MTRLPTGGRSTALALMGCVLLVCGCASLQAPRIDPTGERIFAEPIVSPAPAYPGLPGPSPDSDRMDLVICPQETVASVGTEVVVLAGVRGSDQYLRTNDRVEWMLDPQGAGQFVELGKGTAMDLLVGDFTRPRKVDNTFAVGSTSRSHLRLTRGTPTPADDVCVLPGQAWITVTSSTEGTSRVTAYAPKVPRWDRRQQSATIHWVDAQWCFPPPAINPAGTSHVLTTTVTRQTDGAPCTGWLVRYEILDGPAAGFAPDGARLMEVPTNELGRASAEIFQQRPAPGTNQIAIQIIRPAAPGGHPGRPMVVGRGTTLKTWSAPEIAVRKTGPTMAGVGHTLTYCIEVSNPGDLAADDVTLTDPIPEGLTYLASNPAGELVDGSVQWQLGTLIAGQTRSVQIDFRADQQGSVTNRAEATAAGGLSARDSVTTSVTAPALDVQVYGPKQPVTVGDEVTFEIVVTNRAQAPATDLIIKDRFDPGLEHAEVPSPIARDLGTLAPGQSQRVGVVLRVTAPGRLSNTVEITSQGQVLATATASVTALEAAAVEPKPKPAIPPPVGAARVSVKMTGPLVSAVGDKALFVIDVTNKGQQALTDVNVSANFDPSFYPAMATDGHTREGEDVVWTVNTLPPGSTQRFRVECACLTAAVDASARVRVTTLEGDQDEDEALVEIREAPAPGPSELTMTIAPFREPVALGREFTYLIRVVNRGPMPDHQVALEVSVPPELTPIRFGTFGPPSTEFQIAQEIGRQVIRFSPADVIEPDPQKPLEYRVRVHAVGAGEVQLQAELTSQNLVAPITETRRTTIFLQQ